MSQSGLSMPKNIEISTDAAYLKHISLEGSIKKRLESEKLPLSSFASVFQPYGHASMADILNAPQTRPCLSFGVPHIEKHTQVIIQMKSN